MKILTSKLKKWSSKKRLKIMRQYLDDIEETTILKMPGEDQEKLDKALQILGYWLDHIEDPPIVDNKKSKQKKPVNLWN